MGTGRSFLGPDVESVLRKEGRKEENMEVDVELEEVFPSTPSFCWL